MAAATTIKFSRFRVLLSDGASPITFSAPCGFNQRSLNRTKELTEIEEPDCDDEDDPAWIGREVKSLSWSVTGEGVLPQESVRMWETFFGSSSSRGVRLELLYPSETIFYEGMAHLANYTIGANRGEKVTVNIDLQGDGALVEVVTT